MEKLGGFPSTRVVCVAALATSRVMTRTPSGFQTLRDELSVLGLRSWT